MSAASDVASTDQYTALFANPAVTTVADNFKLCPALTVAVAGETVTLVTLGATVPNTTPVFERRATETTPYV